MSRHVILDPHQGPSVYVDLISSSAGHYLSRHPHVVNLLKEVLESLSLTKAKITLEHDMGRVIGNTDIVATTDKDVIFYAQPIKKTVFSRYAKNRYPLPSKKLAIILERDGDGDYEVSDTWIGPCSPPFPGDEAETGASRTYWESHALAEDTQLVQSKTITRDCPY